MVCDNGIHSKQKDNNNTKHSVECDNGIHSKQEDKITQKRSVECDNGIHSKQEDKITQNIVWSVTMAFILNKKTK